MSKDKLRKTLNSHQDWLNGDGGERANLCGANLSEADLSEANLSRANLSEANLSRANLCGANLSEANLSRAYLCGANLSRANLCGANLCGADLFGAYGNLKELKSMFIETWPITYTSDVMQIGCERHDIDEWWEFDGERIARMDSKAMEWWKKWKPVLQRIIKESPAVPTGYVEKDTPQEDE